ncbi:LacI family DNA-binding transcriptional regulator [Propionibacteriaceae bacterium Y2011]
MAQTTLYEVAERAGVSLATASRVLNGSTRKVGQELSERVLAAARELRYTANGPAQAMARGHSNTIGLVVADIADPYFTQIAAGVIEAADAHGITVTMGTTGRAPGREAEHLAVFRSQRARGVVIVGSRVDREASPTAPNTHASNTDASNTDAPEGSDADALRAELDAYREAGGSVVLVSQPIDDLPTVEIENRKLAAELGRALVDQGHRDFAVLAGPAGLLTAVDRTEGFRNGLRSRQVALAKDRIVAGGFNRAGGHEAMRALLARNDRPGCVFAVNDVMALGAVAAIREAGLRPGVDIAVAGFDDIPTLADVHPSITTVHLPLREAGQAAVELLLDPDGAPGSPITGEVLLRESTHLATPSA